MNGSLTVQLKKVDEFEKPNTRHESQKKKKKEREREGGGEQMKDKEKM